ncbi:unnamed protein product, partial [Prorocentrum cordatum]
SGARPERQSAIHGRFELSAHTENEEEEEEEEEKRERDRDSHGGHRGAPWPHRSARHPGPGPACPAAQTGEAAREGEGCEAAAFRTKEEWGGDAGAGQGEDKERASGARARHRGSARHAAPPAPRAPAGASAPGTGGGGVPASAGQCALAVAASLSEASAARDQDSLGQGKNHAGRRRRRGGGGRGEGGGTPKVTTYAPRVNRGPPKSAPTGGGRPGEVRGRQRWPKVQKPRGARAPGLGAGGLRGLAGGVRLHPGGPPR